ncbi:hypothetical protein CLU79DRAFT_745637 [Phycomyces nitens]|nr:hypothetical protein CLU79DRAFT_745637 [Phycomyces nitens]
MEQKLKSPRRPSSQGRSSLANHPESSAQALRSSLSVQVASESIGSIPASSSRYSLRHQRRNFYSNSSKTNSTNSINNIKTNNSSSNNNNNNNLNQQDTLYPESTYPSSKRKSQKRKQVDPESSNPKTFKRSKKNRISSQQKLKDKTMAEQEQADFLKSRQTDKLGRTRKTTTSQPKKTISDPDDKEMDSIPSGSISEATKKGKSKAVRQPTETESKTRDPKTKSHQKQPDTEPPQSDPMDEGDPGSSPSSYYKYFGEDVDIEETGDDIEQSLFGNDGMGTYEDEDWENENEEYDEDDDEQHDDIEDTEEELDRVRRNLGFQMQDIFDDTSSDITSRLHSILANLRSQDDPTMQLIALQTLSEILSVSSEETLSSFFTSDSFVKELVRIMKGPDDLMNGDMMDDDMMMALAMSEGMGGGNPEIMLLACRCIANLLDAMPTAATSVLYHKGVKVLCEKLKSIEYIDLAEQALCALEKVAAHFPRAVVNEGGLSATLMFFDFFSIHSQRTALRTAANCMRGVDSDTFEQVMEVVPAFTSFITYSDRTIVELACLCWVRLAESYRNSRENLERAISPSLLSTTVSLLPVSGNPNAVRPSTFNDLLRFFRAVAKSSPTLACELIKADIISVFYQILTGAPLPVDNIDASVTITQLDSKWRDSVPSITKIFADLLPHLPKGDMFSSRRFKEVEPIASRTRSAKPTPDTKTDTDPRIVLFKDQPNLLKRINFILVPILLEIYTSTVNVRVRQYVTHILVKLIYFSEAETLQTVLKNISFSSFLASILAQQEHPTLVMDSLFMAEILIKKLPGVYRSLFEREGVLHEIETLGTKPLSDTEPLQDKSTEDISSDSTKEKIASQISEASAPLKDETTPKENDTVSESTATEDATDSRSVGSPSPGPRDEDLGQAETLFGSSFEKDRASLLSARRRLFDREDIHALLRSRLGHAHQSAAAAAAIAAATAAANNGDNEKGIGCGSTRRHIIQLAQNFVSDYYEQTMSESGESSGRSLCDIRKLAQDLVSPSTDNYQLAIKNLLYYLEESNMGISSFELINSGLLDSLVSYLSDNSDTFSCSLAVRHDTFRRAFIQDYRQSEKHASKPSALRVLIKRLQEILSRVEPFEVVSPLESASSDSARNPTSMLAKQLRLRLTGEGSDIPREYNNLMVSTHAVATFRVLEEYLLARLGNSSVSDEADNEDGIVEDDIDTDNEDENEHKMDIDEDHSSDDARDLPADSGLESSSKRLATPTSDDPQSTTQAPTSVPSEQKASTSDSDPCQKPGKWQIRFSLKDTHILSDTTVYGAVHEYELRTSNNDGLSRSIWSTSYPITFERVWVADTEEDNSNGSKQPLRQLDSSEKPEALLPDSVCTKVLTLLKSLSGLCISDSQAPGEANVISAEDFINRKLTAKMNRQLEEPLIVASSCLPKWLYWLMSEAPFLFPFETRYLFIQSTSFGYSRLISRWQSLQMRNTTQNGSREDTHNQQQQPILGRMERQKVRIIRSQMLESAIKILDLFGSSQSVLEVEYTGEEGTGLGPSLEFYASTSKEFCKKSINLWRDDGSDSSSLYVGASQGLFPKTLPKNANGKSVKKILNLFKTLGQFVAKAMLDFRIIDIPFSVAFFKLALDESVDQDSLIKDIDPTLNRSLDTLQSYIDQKNAIYADTTKNMMQQIKEAQNITVNNAVLKDLCLDFTLPGDPSIELKPGGSEIPVTINNVEEYVSLLKDSLVGSGVAQQLDVFRKGFNGLFAIDDLKILSHQELVSLFGKSSEDWSYATLADTIKADHGFTMESPAFKNLLEILSEMDDDNRRDFLQFTTGSPRLPIGGWKAIRPVFTVVRKVPEAPLCSDDYLPSVMTCANYLKMPDYTSKSVMEQRIFKSMKEGKNSFLLS